MLPASLAPSYFTPIPGLPTVPPPSSRNRPVSPATVRREVALGNYELSRRCAEVSDYNNPLDALQTRLAIAAEEKTLQEDVDRQRRRARREERELAKSLRKLRLEHRGSNKAHSRSRSSRKATPYVSERSASSSSSSSESGEQTARRRRRRSKHLHEHQDYDHKLRRKSPSAGHRPHAAEIFDSKPVSMKYACQHIEGVAPVEDPKGLPTRAIPQIELTVPSNDSRHSSSQSHVIPVPRAGHVTAPPTDPTPDRFAQRDISQVSRTPARISVGHVDQYKPDNPKANSPDEPTILHLVFMDGRGFGLTHKEVLAGGPKNSFLRSWTNCSHRPSDGEVLTIKMPHDRDPDLFHVIHDFLNGIEVIPLSYDHAVRLCGRSPAPAEVYKRLYTEAKLYGIQELANKLKSYQIHQQEESLECFQPFRVYDGVSNVALGKRDLRTIARYVHAVSDKPKSPFRAVIVGAAVNFMTRKVDTHGLILEYSLVTPLTSLSRTFSEIIECSVEEEASQIVFEGSLTSEESRNVILNVMSFDDAGQRGDRSTTQVKRYPYTLEAVLSALQPSHDLQNLPKHLSDTFRIQHFDSRDDNRDRYPSHHTIRSSSSSSSAGNSTGKYYLNLPYATICLRFCMPDSKIGKAQAIFEQIHTATRDVLTGHTSSALTVA